LRLRVRDLPEDGRSFAGTVAAAPIEDVGDGVALRGPISFALRVRLEGEGGRVVVSGWYHSTATIPCSRCLRPVRRTIDGDMETVFLPALEGEETAEAELDESDLDVDHYADGVLDLRAVLTEQVLLEIPMRVLCKEDCKGLCAQCGTDLNLETCSCQPPTDPRLSSLADIRKRL